MCKKTPRIALWWFPPEDFAAWCELVGTPEVHTYADYVTLLAAMEVDQERQGRTVVRVRMTVRQMRERLKEHGYENTPDKRAAIIGLYGTD